jgi:regulator of sigma E protease
MINGNLLLNILGFVLAIGFLAFLHELGHFLVSRFFKIEIEEFGFGFPPRIAHLFNLGGTEFTLNAIPFGAFVRPKGENNPEVEGGLAAANPWARLAVLFGGPVVNILTGVLLFSLIFVRTGIPDLARVQIVEINKNSPAEVAGLISGDIITRIDNVTITGMDILSQTIKASRGKEITLSYDRDGKTASIITTPRLNPPAGEGSLGIIMTNPIQQVSILQAIPFAAYFTYEQGKQIFLLPGRLIRGQIDPAQARVVGVVGMGQIYLQAVEEDKKITASPDTKTPAVNVLSLFGIISIALGITNLLPLPALDGGRILFVLPEILIRRRIPAAYENMVHLVGFAALIALMVYVTAQDIINPIVLP